MSLRWSEFGDCIRALVAKELGYAPAAHSEATEALFAMGRTHEDECLAAMRADQWVITDEQHEVEFLGILGHLDGIGSYDDGRPRVIEVKSPKSWAKFQDAYLTNTWTDALAVRYAWQCSGYQHATGLECVVATLDEGRVRTFVIETPIHSQDDIYNRHDVITHLIGLGEAGLIIDCEPHANSFFCQMAAVTGCRDRTTTPNSELDNLVWEREACRERIAGDQARVKELDKGLREILAEQGASTLTTAYASVTEYSQASPFKWDVDRMVADGINPAEYKIPGAPSSRLKVTIRKGTDDEA